MPTGDDWGTTPMEFVYLNEVSLIHNLSSLGEGIPQEGVEEEREETETEGSGGLSIGSGLLGAFKGSLEGRYASIDQEGLETTVRYATPYLFHRLRDDLDDQNVDVYNASDSPERGDIVEITGRVKPMSVFKFDLVFRELLGINPDEETEAYIDQLYRFVDHTLYERYVDVFDEESSNKTERATNHFQKHWENWEDYPDRSRRLIDHFTNNRLPLRIVVGSEDSARRYGFVLDRRHMRENPVRAFSNGRRFTVFGRFETESSQKEPRLWDPTRLTDTFYEGGDDAEMGRPTLISDWMTRMLYMARISLGMEGEYSYRRADIGSVRDDIDAEWEDVLIEGIEGVIHPIAVYW